MISVVMSIYKTRKDYVRESILSILNQTFSDFEFIIINNGSDREINELILSFNDKRIKILETKNIITLYESRTLGFKEAKSEWIALMDADDKSLPNRFELQLKFIKEAGNVKIACVGSWARYMNDHGEVIGHRRSRPTNIIEFNEMKISNEAIITTDPSAIINKKAFFEVGGYRSEYTPAADLDLWYRIVENEYLIISIPEYYFYYRIHKDADSTKKFMLQRKKTHFANLNMKRRRLNLNEVNYNFFLENYWSKLSYRFPRQWRNYAKFFYKKAGLSYLSKNYPKVLLYIIPAILFNPIYVYNRVLSHVFKVKTL